MSLLMRNLADLGGAHALPNITFNGSSTSNGDPQTGVTIDRLALGRRYLSLLAIPHGSGSQGTSSETSKAVTVALSMQDSPTTTAWSSYSTGENATVTFGSSNTGTSSTSFNSYGKGVSFDISRARRYIRVNATYSVAQTSAGAAGTFTGGVAAVFGGAEEVPAV